MSYYVYELIDPRDSSVFYVGKGKKGRIDQHEVEARKGRQSRKCDRIREIEAAGLNVGKRKVSHHKEELDAYDAEVELIAFHGLSNLTNIASGGGGKGKTGPTTYEDRHLVCVISKLFRRVHGRTLGVVDVLGHKMDLSDIPRMMEKTIERVAKRRSLQWVNEVAAKYHVEYKFA